MFCDEIAHRAHVWPADVGGEVQLFGTIYAISVRTMDGREFVYVSEGGGMVALAYRAHAVGVLGTPH